MSTDGAPDGPAEETPAEAAPAAPAASGPLAAVQPYLPGRREAMWLLGGGLVGAGVGGGGLAYASGHAAEAVTSPDRSDKKELTAREARERLKAGNERFVDGVTQHPDQSTARRKALKKAQHPFAIVLSCADSRVPPELLFDQGLGDLFVVRSAGQVIDHAVLGSLQYGVAELGAPLLVVLGHSQCGAIKATVEVVEGKAKATGTDIDALVHALTPAVHEAHEAGAGEEDLVSVAVDCNVELIVEQLKGAPVLGNASLTRKVKIVGATYSLATGEVDWL